MSIVPTVSGQTMEIQLPHPSQGCLSRQDTQSLAIALSFAETDPDVRAVVILSPKGGFCRGLDLQEFADEEQLDELSAVLENFFNQLSFLQKPLFVSVDGPAVGMGLTLLCHADYVVASSKAEFSAPFVSLGLVPEAASTSFLQKRVGYLRAFRLLCLGDRWGPEQALEQGLVSHIVDANPNADALSAAHRFVRQSAVAASKTFELMKDESLATSERILCEIEASQAQLKRGGSRGLLKRVIQTVRRAARAQGRAA